jgi:hypothetical protein
MYINDDSLNGGSYLCLEYSMNHVERATVHGL